MKRTDKKEKQHKRGFFASLWRVVRTILIVAAGAMAAFLLFFAVKLLNIDSWKDFDPDKILSAPQTLIVYDGSDAEAVRLHAKEDRVYKRIEELPDHVQKAFISAEDARFYKHRGVDFIRVMGALWTDIKQMRFAQGASTITQQLIKLSHLTSEKTIARKLEEAVLAMQMERLYEKDDILEMYLNYVYFGAGCYGIEAAALNYFGIEKLNKAGIRVIVLTGDNSEVTRCVCNKVGIKSKNIVLGSEIDKLQDLAVIRLLKKTNIFAKLSPIQKARIVRLLKDSGNIVGYMGDGINDSPSLTNSDVGVSVDTAVDIAKESADIILLEKDLNVLLDGVTERKKNFW